MRGGKTKKHLAHPLLSPPPPPAFHPGRCPTSLQTLVSFVEEHLKDTLGREEGEGGREREGGAVPVFKSPNNGFLVVEG